MCQSEASLLPIARALDFCEAHLRSNITIAHMADAAGYSLYHFCRTFNQVTQHTPYDYLMRRRLSEAALELKRTDQRILEIAYDFGFNSPEGFGRAFKRMFEMQPNEFRKKGRLDWRQVMPRLTEAHLGQLGGGKVSRPRLLSREPMRIVGLMAQDDPAGTAVAELWRLVEEEWSCAAGLQDEMPAPDRYGVIWYPDHWEERGILYLAGFDGGEFQAEGTGLVYRNIPGGEYLSYTHSGSRASLPLTLDLMYHTWLPKFGRKPSLPMVVERFLEAKDRTGGEKIEVNIPILLCRMALEAFSIRE